METAGILRKKFEALRMHEEQQNQTPPPIKAQFRPKRFKVIFSFHQIISRKYNSKSSQIVQPMRKQDSFDWLVLCIENENFQFKKKSIFLVIVLPLIDDFTLNSDEIKGF